MSNRWRLSHSLSPSAHLLYKTHRIFPKVFRTYRFLDIFFVHFLRLLYSFATSTSKNNKNNLTKRSSSLTAFMVSRPQVRRKVRKWAQKKAPRLALIRIPDLLTLVLTPTNEPTSGPWRTIYLAINSSTWAKFVR